MMTWASLLLACHSDYLLPQTPPQCQLKFQLVLLTLSYHSSDFLVQLKSSLGQ